MNGEKEKQGEEKNNNNEVDRRKTNFTRRWRAQSVILELGEWLVNAK